MTNAAQHTPTPWAYHVGSEEVWISRPTNEGAEILCELRFKLIDGCPQDYEETLKKASFVVRASNSHDELLAAARYAARPDVHRDFWLPKLLSAIAKAEGK